MWTGNELLRDEVLELQNRTGGGSGDNEEQFEEV